MKATPPNRREFLGQGAAGMAALAGLDPLSRRRASRPNFIFITCHDLGRHLGCYGVRTVHTPHLDGLAAEGVRFSDSFCVAPQCSPSRAAMVTGRYPHSNGVMGLSHELFAWSLNSDCVPIAKLLKARGWHTALAGGQHETHDPRTLGFDELFSGGLFRPCEEVTAQSIDYLERHRGGGAPFYLQIGFHEPHRPFDWGGARPDDSLGVTVPSYLVDDPGAEKECAGIQGSIRKMDGEMGRLLKAIDRLGLRENTLLVFTTDHGIAFPRAKCAVYDPGLETCLILRWPGAGWAAAGRTVPTMVSNIDYLPTFFDLLGVPLPANVQGRSFAALLRGQAYQPREAIFGELTYHDYYDPRRCVRTGTHKLIVNFSNSYFFMDPSQEWYRGTITRSPADPAYAYHKPVELYDLRSDPAETVNLADASGHAAIKARLLRRLGEWMSETGDALLTGIPMSPMHRRALAALRSGGAG